MLALHILQAALVYVNTLMIQDILAEPEWAGVLTAEDLRGLAPAGIIEHHGRGEWRIFDPLLRRYLQQLPGEARHP